MSVTVCNLVANPQLDRLRSLAMPALFGLFQGLMPVLGYFAGSLAASFIEQYAGVITFVILGFIGGKMVWDGIRGEEDEGESGLTLPAIVLQAVATSIDAFAVGVSFAARGVDIFASAAIITSCTCLLCLAMLVIGRAVGTALGSRAQIVGGVVLVAIGVKELLF